MKRTIAVLLAGCLAMPFAMAAEASAGLPRKHPRVPDA